VPPSRRVESARVACYCVSKLSPRLRRELNEYVLILWSNRGNRQARDNDSRASSLRLD
jgi:hypothetical protein